MRRKQQHISKVYIGIDNGVSGSIGWTDGIHFGQTKTPVFKEQNYTKKKGNISRINHIEVMKLFSKIIKGSGCFAVIERPMVNPGRFAATISAVRSLESTLIILESLAIPYQYIDSKEWQKDILPKGIKGSDKLKVAGKTIAKRLFPSVECKPDADGILMAEWARRQRL